MKHLRYLGSTLLVSVLTMTLALSASPRASFPEAEGDDRESIFPNRGGAEGKWSEETLERLSLREKVGQLLQLRYYADYRSAEDPNYITFRAELQKYHIGSVVFGMRFNKSGPVRVSPLSAAKIANQMQRDSRLPLLLAADLERGVSSRLTDVPSFPWPMAFGAIDDVSEVRHFAEITARQARAVGIQWALAPVADVNSNSANPVINTRSFGEDSGHVGALVTAFIRGAHENGLLVTVKHFPGNGDTMVDSHLRIASIEGDSAHLENVEFPPFRQAIDAGVDAVMLAHARVPALEPDPDKITTISSKVVTDTLKGQLGFQGVVVTDALDMPGLTRIYDPQKGSPTARAAVDAIKAGCDLIMIPTDVDGAFHAIINAVRKGEIPESQIDQSVAKILRMKASVGLHRARFVDLERVTALTSDPKDIEFAQHTADQAVTLVRDSKKLLPLVRSNVSGESPKNDSQSHPIVALLLDEAFTSTDGKEFERALKVRRPDAEVFYFDNHTGDSVRAEVLKAISGAEQVILGVYVAHNGVRHIVVDGKLLSSFGPLGPSGKLLEEALAVKPQNTVVVALGNPYLIVNFPEIRTYICTYSQTSTSEVSAVKALFGEIQNHAKLPITLPGIAQRGFSLPWPARTKPQGLNDQQQ